MFKNTIFALFAVSQLFLYNTKINSNGLRDGVLNKEATEFSWESGERFDVMDFDVIDLEGEEILNEPEEIDSVKESRILFMLDKFVEEIDPLDFENYASSFRRLCDDICKIADKNLPTNIIKNKIQSLIDLQFTKYRDHTFSKYGFIINSCYSGYHIILMQIEKTSTCWSLPLAKKTFTIRYQVIPDPDLPSHSVITNMSLVFLNSDRFEVFRVFIGDLKEGCCATGKFDIDEKLYNEIRSVRSITDQDGWDPGIFHFGLSAKRHR